MVSTTHAAAADLKMLHRLESGGGSPQKVPISLHDFALSVALNLPAEQKLWGNLQHFKNSDDQVLSTWAAVRSGSAIVFSRGSFGMMVVRLVVVYGCVAVLTAMACPHQTAHSIDKVTKMAVLLRIFVALLLSFLLFSSMTRWQKGSSGFLALFDAIQNLQMQFIAFGCADDEDAMRATSYGLLSAHLLNMKLCCETKGGEARKSAFADMWAKVSATEGGAMKCNIGHCGVLRDEEVEILQNVQDAPGMIWVWIASLIGRMAQDGSIPDMQSPTFGDMMDLAEVARNGIRQVQSCTSDQTSDMYVRMLAVAVQISNIMSAVSFGMMLGVPVGVFLVDQGVPAVADAAEHDPQTLLLAFLFCVCGPALYQVFLEVAVLVALPFASKYEETPAKEMISRLEMNLTEASMVSRQWQQPSFKVLSAP